MSPPLLAVENLRTTFDTDAGEVTAVDGVSFTLEAGTTVGIVGESGSGKSVSVRSIGRLIRTPGRIEEGSVRWKGQDILEMSDAELRHVRGQEISMIFQDAGNALDSTYTVGAQIVEAVRAHQDVSDEEAWAQAVDLLEEVGIPNAEERVHQYPHNYSGGMQQRAMIAIALANKPELLIADEPTTGLDVTTQAKILKLFERLQSEYEMTVLLITHNIGVVSEVCDGTLVMYAGRIVERGRTEDVLTDPKHPYSRALLSSVPHIDNPGRLDPIEGNPPNLADPPPGCRFHPRCPEAKPVCAAERPPEQSFGRGHTAECYIGTQPYADSDAEPGSLEGRVDLRPSPNPGDHGATTERGREAGEGGAGETTERTR